MTDGPRPNPIIAAQLEGKPLPPCVVELKTHWIVCYRQYGQWSATCPFETRAEADKHVRLYLLDPKKDYIKDITYIETDLPK